MRHTPQPADTHVLEDLAARVRALECWRAHHGDLLDTLLTQADPPATPGRRQVEPLDPPALIDWVHRHVTAIIARPLRGEIIWCPRWFEHPEAILRFEALRRAWEELAAQPGVAMSVWIRDHLDPCLRELTSPLGAFADCRHSERARPLHPHRPLHTLPVADPTDTNPTDTNPTDTDQQGTRRPVPGRRATAQPG